MHRRRQDKVHNWPALVRQSPSAPLHFLAELEDSEAWEEAPAAPRAWLALLKADL